MPPSVQCGLLARSVLLGALSFAAGALASDDEASRVQAEIERLRAERALLEARGAALGDERDGVQRELAEVEAALGRLRLALNQSEREIAALEQRERELVGRREAIREELAVQRQALARRVRVSYALGRNAELRLLLAQDQVRDLGRTLGYQRVVQQQHRGLLDWLAAQLAELAAVLDELAELRGQTEQALARQAAELAAIERRRGERAVVLAELERALGDTRARAEELARNERELQQLLEQLRDIFADIPKDLGRAPRFSTLQGRLPWPIEGRVLSRFGARMDNGRRSDGLLLAAEAGSPVRVVASGRVAFSEWMRGFGLLAIVDHGDGYLSLYAHAEALLVEAGDWIEAGEPIALAGDSGGRARPALYFELRHDGRPVDPLRWLQRRG